MNGRHSGWPPPFGGRSLNVQCDSPQQSVGRGGSDVTGVGVICESEEREEEEEKELEEEEEEKEERWDWDRKKEGLHGDVGYLLRVTHGNRPADDSPPLYQPHKACTLTPCTATRTRSQFRDFKCRFFHTAPTQISHQDAHARHKKGGGRVVVAVEGGGQDDSHINDNTPHPPRPNHTQTEDISFGFYPHPLHILGNLPLGRQQDPPTPTHPPTAGPVTSHESHLIRASFSIPLARIDDLI